MTRARHLYVSVLILAIAVAFQALSYGMPENSRLMPVFVGWIAIVLCVLDVIAHTGTAVGRRTAQVLSGSAYVTEEKPGAGLPAELRAFLWIILACAGIVVFGFLWTVPVYVFAYLVLRGRKPLLLAGSIGLGATLAIWVVFELLLENQIYRGLLFFNP